MLKKQTTKERLIKAASEIFAEKGFRDTTVAEICETAGANIAAVNYHFGDKEHLYDEVWRHAFALAIEAYPLNGGLPENPGIEDYLYSHASAILHRIFSENENGLFAKLLYREMASPTLALERIAQEALFPQSEFIQEVVDAELGAKITGQQLRLCMNSIIGQCAFYNFSRPLQKFMIGKETVPEEKIESIARHIARFSLGGLNATKQEKE
ncbi:MAG: CerR family C-terminal domain-containing protein [Verrucomicrobiota bacterium]